MTKIPDEARTLDKGFIYARIGGGHPPVVDPAYFSVRKGLWRTPEPGAVDQLAALSDPDGEAADRVMEWKGGKVCVPKLIRPEFYGTVTVENL